MSASQSNDEECTCGHPTLRQKVAVAHVTLCGLFFSFLVLGLPLLFVGCNPNVKNMCLTYDLVHGTAYGYELTNHTCADCASCDGEPCNCGPVYPCYQGYVDLHYGGPGEDCTYKYHRKYDTQQRTMENLQQDYPLNGTSKFILDRDDQGEKVCEDVKSGMGAWTGGLVLLCLAAGTLIAWVVFGYYFREVARGLLSAIISYNRDNNSHSHIPMDIWNETTSEPRRPGDSSPHLTSDPSPYTAVRADVEMTHVTPAYVTNSSSYSNAASVVPYPVSVSPTSVYVIPTAIVADTNVNNNVGSPGYPTYSTSGHY